MADECEQKMVNDPEAQTTGLDDTRFGRGPNRVSVPLTSRERAMLEEIAAVWGVSVPLASRRLLLLAANVTAV